VFICEVGVGHFTPPELQGISGFAGVKRTAQHDVFGLALLIFHLLFGGRHPYSGVPLTQDVGNALEEDIKKLRFAYSRDAQQRGIAPPPRSIPISLVPANVEGMFRYAFTEPGVKGQRPTAATWVTALDGVLCDLQRCESSTLHCYPKHLPSCPWCELDNSGVVFFIDLAPPPLASAVFDIAKVWSQIEAFTCPPALPPPVQAAPVAPRPLPTSANRKGEVVVYRAFILAAALGLSLAVPSLCVVFLFAALIGCGAIGSLGETERRAERMKREAALKDAMSAMAAAEANTRLASGIDAFTARKQRLLVLRNEYVALASVEQKEIAALQSTAQARQLQKFLETFFIEDAGISGVGPAKKAALQSFGIETAADVEWSRVHAVKGFGRVLTAAVMGWRKQCEKRFRFDPQRAVSQADVDAVKAKCAHRRKQLEIELAKGPNELWSIQQQGQTKISVFQARLTTAATHLAQARADMTVFS
jgi:DNA-binding helix-hairpin-helix protein with protein kinase domain